MTPPSTPSTDAVVLTFSAAASWLLGFAFLAGAVWYEFRLGPSEPVVFTEACALAFLAPASLVLVYGRWAKR